MEEDENTPKASLDWVEAEYKIVGVYSRANNNFPIKSRTAYEDISRL